MYRPQTGSLSERRDFAYFPSGASTKCPEPVQVTPTIALTNATCLS